MGRWVALMVVALGGVIAGCSGDGPARFRVSGAASFNGQPIPYGEVLFTPDGAKGNSGPQGIAQIRNGKYDTAGADGKGVAGGPTVIRVTGLTGPGGKLLCEWEMQVDLPRSDGTHDIDVPKAGEAKPKGPDI
jgi:hypothetical protein